VRSSKNELGGEGGEEKEAHEFYLEEGKKGEKGLSMCYERKTAGTLGIKTDEEKKEAGDICRIDRRGGATLSISPPLVR